MTPDEKVAIVARMEKAEIIRSLLEAAPSIRARGGVGLSLFGSVKNDRAGPASDVDLLLDFDRNRDFSLVDLIAIKHLLEDRLQRPVDLLTRDGIDHRLKARILADAERVF